MNRILPIWKEKGLSSFDVIRKVKSNLKNLKIGHCGTLDPFAEGILILCTGNKTKDVKSFMDFSKTYEAEIYLGAETDTLDSTGKIIKESNNTIDFSNLKSFIENYKGTVMQSPPYYSALKINGVRLYSLARNDIFIRKKPRPVKIEHIEILDIEKNILKLKLVVGKGFYVRSFAKDLAKSINTYGYLINLKRLSIGKYDFDTVVEINSIKND